MNKKLSEEVQELAHSRGLSADTLVNLWIQEKLREQIAWGLVPLKFKSHDVTASTTCVLRALRAGVYPDSIGTCAEVS